MNIKINENQAMGINQDRCKSSQNGDQEVSDGHRETDYAILILF